MEENFTDVFQKACLIQMSASVWMGSRMLDQEVMEQIGQSDWLKGRKFLINPELLGPIKTSVHMARNTIVKYALPFPITSLYLIPKESLRPVDEALAEYKSKFWTRVHDLEAQYELAREEAKDALGDLFSEEDYPPDITKKFKFDWRFLAIDLPKKSKILTPEIYQREKEKFEQLMEETRQMATEALAGELGNIVTNLVERLNGNGKLRSINSSMLNRMREFVEVFETRNLFDDDKLSAVVSQARSILDGISPYGLKFQKELRNRISTELGKINDTVKEMIQDLPRRKIRMQEM